MVKPIKKFSMPYVFGRELANGLFSYVIALFLVYLIVSGMWWTTKHFFGVGLNDSDLNSRYRSGMQVYVDHKTGVQYLGVDGALIVRVDKDGNIVTIRP